MTIRKAVSVIQTVLQATIYEMQKRHDPVANELDNAWIVVREIALKTENRRSDERSTTAWMNMPEAEDKTETERLADRTLNMVEELYEKIVRLQGNLCQVEKQTTKNEIEIEMLKERMPKEWK